MVADDIIEIMKPAVGNHESHWGACVASGEIFVFCDLFQDGIRSIGDNPDILLAAFILFYFFLFPLPLSAAFLCSSCQESSPDTLCILILCLCDCSQQSLYDNNSPVGLPMSMFSFPATISCFRMRHAHNTHAPSGTSSKSNMYIHRAPTGWFSGTIWNQSKKFPYHCFLSLFFKAPTIEINFSGTHTRLTGPPGS